MASFLSGLKSKAIDMLPGLIETAGPQIEEAARQAMKRMSPQQKQIFSVNLNKINTVVQQEMSKPQTQSPVVQQSPVGGKKRTLKLKKRKTK